MELDTYIEEEKWNFVTTLAYMSSIGNVRGNVTHS
jgi:hypothetical protein